jgi:hypothetical protein
MTRQIAPARYGRGPEGTERPWWRSIFGGNNANDQDTLRNIAHDLRDLGGRLGSMKDDALARLYSPEYDTLRLRLEVAHAAVEAAAVEARRRMRLSEGPKGE